MINFHHAIGFCSNFKKTKRDVAQHSGSSELACRGSMGLSVLCVIFLNSGLKFPVHTAGTGKAVYLYTASFASTVAGSCSAKISFLKSEPDNRSCSSNILVTA